MSGGGGCAEFISDPDKIDFPERRRVAETAQVALADVNDYIKGYRMYKSVPTLTSPHSPPSSLRQISAAAAPAPARAPLSSALCLSLCLLRLFSVCRSYSVASSFGCSHCLCFCAVGLAPPNFAVPFVRCLTGGQANA
jgi:hypothetical protein